MMSRWSMLVVVALGCSSDPAVRIDDAGAADVSVDLGAAVDDAAGSCRIDQDCDDGDFCNGAEFCVGVGVPSANAAGCIRRERSGEERAARCQGALCTDRDGDGHRPTMDNGMACTGALTDDCDDNDSRRYPRSGTPDPSRRWVGANERCSRPDEHDDDCDALTVAGPNDGDLDGDGYPSANCCNVISPLTLPDAQRAMLGAMRLTLIGSGSAGAVCGTDCNDRDPAVHPGAMENPCNEVDDNCDGVPDEGGRGTLYRDCDGDGDGDPMGAVLNACLTPVAIICNGFPGSRTNTDCNDRDPRVKGPSSQAEMQCDGLDNNCDGMADNGPGMECAIAPPGQPDTRRTCTDSTCSMSVGVQLCQACQWLPRTCARGYDRPVVLNTNRHECEPGEVTNTRCSAPGHTSNCGRVVCNATCEADARGECRFDREVCDYLDQDCNSRTDEGLGRGCEQTWQAAGNGFAADWQLINAAIDPMNGEIVLNTGARMRASAAFLPLPIERSRSLEITLRVEMTRGETEGIGDGMAVALVDASMGRNGVGTPSLTEGQGGVPTDLQGYVFMESAFSNQVPFVRIERRGSERRTIQQVDLPIISPITGDTCAGAGTFSIINTGVPSRLYRGGGENEITITMTDQLVSMSMSYAGRPSTCVVATGTEPDASLLGRPLRLAIFASNTTDRTFRARIRSVRLRRPCVPQGGGTCEAAPNYCPGGGTTCS